MMGGDPATTSGFVIDYGITCMDCDKTSHSERDRTERYCGNCHRWHPRVGPEAVAARVLPDGRIGVIYPHGANLGRLLVSTPAELLAGVGSWEWHFPSVRAAVTGLRRWNDGPEPTGWHRDINTGRRRPDGDPAREYVRW